MVAEDAVLARAIIQKAARSLKIDPKSCADQVALENLVFQTAIKQRVERLQVELQKLGPEQTQELERLLRQELAKLSEVDQKAIRQTLQVDRLSAETVLRIFKTSGGTVAAQLLIGGCGFGAYVFLATTLKAIGLLFGATFAFGTYAHASSSLAFALSGWFSLLVLLVGGSFVVMDTAARLDGWKAQLVVVLGHARLLDYPDGMPVLTIQTSDILEQHGRVCMGFTGRKGADAGMAAFADRYGFRFQAHEKGDANRSARVERSFRYIETNFLAGRTFRDWEDANRQARQWCDKVNAKFRDDLKASPRELFAVEQPHWKPLPLWAPPVYLLHQRLVDVEGYVSVESNRYSIPDDLIGRHVEVRQTKDQIEIYPGPRLVATQRD